MYRSLQTGRAAAALLVCLFHAMGCVASGKYFNQIWAAAPLSWGVIAVEYFFVLSGFILFTVHRDDLCRLDRFIPYAIKRIVRIYPTYWLVCAGVLLAALVIPELRSSIAQEPSVILSRLLLIPQYLQERIAEGTPARLLSVGWTLECEVAFYALFGLAMLGRAGCGVLVLGLLAAFGCRIAGWPLPRLGYLVTSEFGIAFLLGVGAGALNRARFRMPLAEWVVGLLILLLFLLHADDARILWPNQQVRGLVTGLCAGGLLLSLISCEERGLPVGGHPWIQTLGDASYALYLIHFPLVSVLTKAAVWLGLPRLGKAGAVGTIVAEVILCVAVSVPFHLWVEKPMLGWLRRKTRSLTATKEVVPREGT
jgi:peptidoglycan/LPS O-acetylase OafA/YrhL